MILRKTRESLPNSTILFFEQEILGPHSAVQHIASKRRFVYPNGSILSYGGMNDEKQREQVRSIGQRGGVDIVWFEEANKFVEDDYNEILARMRGTAAPWTQIILTTNPDSPAHWIYKRLILGGEAAVYSSGARDNPYNPSTYLGSLDKLTGVLRDRLVLGLWKQAEGVIYSDFDPQIHVIDRFDIPADWPRFMAIDFGFNNPFVCLWAAIDNDDRIYVYREWYQSETLVEDHARQITALTGSERISEAWSDHDAEDRATLERYRVRTQPAIKDVLPGIEAVQRRLRIAGDGHPRLFFFRDLAVATDANLVSQKRPTTILEEITLYVWQAARGGAQSKDVPVKADDHACLVAGTLIYTMRGQVPIESVFAGDIVMTRQGWRAVTASGMTASSAAIYRVDMSNGKTLRGTANHPVWVNGCGFVELCALRYGSIIEGCAQNPISQKPLSIMGLSLDDILPLAAGLTESISYPMQAIDLAGWGVFIRKYGRTLMARYRMAAKYIILTATLSIIKSRIWLASLKRRTLNIMSVNTQRSKSSSAASGSLALESAQSIGTSLLPVGNGIASTQNRGGGIESQPLISARNAAKNINQGSRSGISFAETIVGPEQGSEAASIWSSGVASGAARSGASIDTANQSAAPVYVLRVVVERERQAVYNLTVDDAGEYYANGVLVHNCDALRYLCMGIENRRRYGGIYV